jgi:iron complex transport system ATP-binding protein
VSLELRELTVQRGGVDVLRGVDLTVSDGDWVAVVGPNGAGKSTLLHAALGWLRPRAGTVRVGGADPGTLSGSDRARRIGWLPQRVHLAEPLPVVEVVAAARFRFGESVAHSHVAARAALAELDAEGLADRTWTTLSGGEAQRVGLATLVAQQAETWLLDEPGNHLDPAVQHRVHGFLAARWRGGRTLVTVTHDLNLLLAAVGEDAARVQVVGLAGGEISFDCALADETLSEHLAALYGVAVHAVEVGGGRRLLLEGAP